MNSNRRKANKSLNNSLNKSLNRSLNKVIPGLYKKNQASVTQLLSQAAYRRKIKQLQQNNKQLAVALQDAKTTLASHDDIFAQYAKDSTKIMRAKMKVNDMVESLQKLVSDLCDVQSNLDVKPFTLPKQPLSYGGSTTVACAPDVEPIEENCNVRETELCRSSPKEDSASKENAPPSLTPHAPKKGKRKSRASISNANKEEKDKEVPSKASTRRSSVAKDLPPSPQKEGSKTPQLEWFLTDNEKFPLAISNLDAQKRTEEVSSNPKEHHPEVVPPGPEPVIPSSAFEDDQNKKKEVAPAFSQIPQERSDTGNSRRETFVVDPLSNKTPPISEPTQTKELPNRTMFLNEDMELTEIIPLELLASAKTFESKPDDLSFLPPAPPKTKIPTKRTDKPAPTEEVVPPKSRKTYVVEGRNSTAPEIAPVEKTSRKTFIVKERDTEEKAPIEKASRKSVAPRRSAARKSVVSSGLSRSSLAHPAENTKLDISEKRQDTMDYSENSEISHNFEDLTELFSKEVIAGGRKHYSTLDPSVDPDRKRKQFVFLSRSETSLQSSGGSEAKEVSATVETPPVKAKVKGAKKSTARKKSKVDAKKSANEESPANFSEGEKSLKDKEERSVEGSEEKNSEDEDFLNSQSAKRSKRTFSGVSERRSKKRSTNEKVFFDLDDVLLNDTPEGEAKAVTREAKSDDVPAVPVHNGSFVIDNEPTEIYNLRDFMKPQLAIPQKQDSKEVSCTPELKQSEMKAKQTETEKPEKKAVQSGFKTPATVSKQPDSTVSQTEQAETPVSEQPQPYKSPSLVKPQASKSQSPLPVHTATKRSPKQPKGATKLDDLSECQPEPTPKKTKSKADKKEPRASKPKTKKKEPADSSKSKGGSDTDSGDFVKKKKSKKSEIKKDSGVVNTSSNDAEMVEEAMARNSSVQRPLGKGSIEGLYPEVHKDSSGGVVERRSRRCKPINFKEPSLHTKMRRE